MNFDFKRLYFERNLERFPTFLKHACFLSILTFTFYIRTAGAMKYRMFHEQWDLLNVSQLTGTVPFHQNIFPGKGYFALVFQKIFSFFLFPLSPDILIGWIGPLTGGFGAILMYFFGKTIKDSLTGLNAALFFSCVPYLVEETLFGRFSPDSIGYILVISIFFMLVKSIKSGQMGLALFAATAGYLVLANTTPAYVLLMNGFAFSTLALALFFPTGLRTKSSSFFLTFFSLVTCFSPFIPAVGVRGCLLTGDHIFSLAVFVLIVVDKSVKRISQKQLRILSIIIVVLLSIVWKFHLLRFSLGGEVFRQQFVSAPPTTLKTLFQALNLILLLIPAGAAFLISGPEEFRGFTVFFGIFLTIVSSLSSTALGYFIVFSILFAAYGVAVLFRTFSSYSTDTCRMKRGSIETQIKIAIITALIFFFITFLISCLGHATTPHTLIGNQYILRNVEGHDKPIPFDTLRAHIMFMKNNIPHWQSKYIGSWKGDPHKIVIASTLESILGSDPDNPHNLVLMANILTSPQEKAWKLCKEHKISHILIYHAGYKGFFKDIADLFQLAPEENKLFKFEETLLFQLGYYQFSAHQWVQVDLDPHWDLSTTYHLEYFEQIFEESGIMRIFKVGINQHYQ